MGVLLIGVVKTRWRPVFASVARQSMSEFSILLQSGILSWIAAGACAPSLAKTAARFIVSILLSLFICEPVLAAEFSWFDPLLSKKSIRHAQPISPCGREVPHDKILTLADVAFFSLCNNPQTRESWANVLAQAAHLGASRSTYLPTIGADGAQNNSVVAGSSNVTKSVTPSVSLSYLLFDFGGRSASIELTKQGLLSVDYTHNATLQNVLFSAIQAYYQLYSAQGEVEATEATVKSNKTSLDAANLRFKVGLATIADQLQAETVYEQAILQREQAYNQVRIMRGTLASNLGLTPDYEFKIDSSPPKELDMKFTDSIATMLAEAKKSRPDLAASAAQVESAKANLSLQRANGLPSISLSASRSQTRYLTGSIPNQNDSTFTASVHVPIFTGFNTSYQIRAASELLAAQEASYQQTENTVLLDVWNSYNNFQTAKQTLAMTAALLASATKSEQVALERYKAGVGSITDLLSSQAALATGRQQQVQSHYNWLIAKANLLRALGGLTDKAVM